MLKLFHVLDLPKSEVVVMQLFVCGCVPYSWSVMLCHDITSQGPHGKHSSSVTVSNCFSANMHVFEAVTQ
jgi:hypothetical protein